MLIKLIKLFLISSLKGVVVEDSQKYETIHSLTFFKLQQSLDKIYIISGFLLQTRIEKVRKSLTTESQKFTSLSPPPFKDFFSGPEVLAESEAKINK